MSSRDRGGRWINTFPELAAGVSAGGLSADSFTSILGQIEAAGREEGMREAAKIAAAYELDGDNSDEIDILCRSIAREIIGQAREQA